MGNRIEILGVKLNQGWESSQALWTKGILGWWLGTWYQQIETKKMYVTSKENKWIQVDKNLVRRDFLMIRRERFNGGTLLLRSTGLL